MGTRHQQTLRAVHHILAPVFLSGNVWENVCGWISHWIFFVIQFMPGETSPTWGFKNVGPRFSPLNGQSLSLPNGSNPSKRHW